MKKSFSKFLARQELLNKQWSEEYKKKQHQRGKLTARERILFLFDEGTFEETDTFMPSAPTSFGKHKSVVGDGVITGYGEINGVLVYAYAQDFNALGGSLGSVHASKIVKIQEMALKTGSPIIALIDSGGARIQEGISSLDGYAKIFRNNVLSSGVIPQISVIMGPAAGGAVYSPALTDFIFMTADTSYMFVTGPNVIKEVLNETVTPEALGGASTHTTETGVADFVFNDDENTLLGVKRLLSFLPSNNMDSVPTVTPTDKVDRIEKRLRDIVPDDADKPYNVKEIIELIVDHGDYFEVATNHAQNIVTAFARLDGKSVGIIANQPQTMAGTLDIDSSVKAARFINNCNAYNIPIITLVDVPGFLPGTDQEHNGIIRHGAKLLYAYTFATVPKITIILRKAYGGAYIVMNSKGIGGDFSFAWPTAEIAVMGAKGAIAILYKKELLNAENPDALKKEFTEKYKEEVVNPYIADDKGYIDEVIDPATTRHKIIRALRALQRKAEHRPNRKHGNIPL
ncbi:MAG: acyl-CoA carboxylase subunit beta [Bacteroides sp.]|nr:acyl-CoA carboxylase subunit beta [Bacteroides sp.]MDD2645037.1 acyl-CoA carboxylase subunit beta [Bacteroides sp.]MDD4055784.1 acyl-CoA carboxylase subunit beta [Bacteroides sp.]MDD4720805.1 acyl-CoA carboxylase subunit beta [Bacteroides sp.]NLI64301.1 acyl-CoA carboxylase subunit beta [Bacteroidales bacterium]